MSELLVSDLIQTYAISKQNMTHFLMQIYKSDENFFKYGEIFFPMVKLSRRKRNQEPTLDSRALDDFEKLYQSKTGQYLQYKKGTLPLKVADQVSNEDKVRKR